MTTLEFGGRLDEHLLAGVPEDGCDICEGEECTCEPDFEAIAEARAESRQS